MRVEERWYTVTEVAEKLSVSRWTITNWLKSRRLKGIKIGKAWRVKESDLDRFLENPPPLQQPSKAQPQEG
jgi:excisionase family DNA binding protein